MVPVLLVRLNSLPFQLARFPPLEHAPLARQPQR